MRSGFTFSLGVHVLLLALIIFGLPFFRPKPPELTPTITVDVIDMAKEATTNKISPANKVEKTPEPETPPPPKPPTPREQITPQVAQVEPVEPQPPTPELQTPDVVLKKQLQTIVPDVDSTQPKVAEIQMPKVELKKQPPKPPAPNFDSVLKNLSKLKPKDSPPTPTPPQPTQVATKAPSGAIAPLSAKLTSSEMGALQQQLAQCWNIPAGSKDAQNLIVELDVTVGPDRVVTHAEIVDQGRLASDPIFRAAAMSAKRALSMPQCTPLALPPEKYDEWKSMTLRFDPKEMLG